MAKENPSKIKAIFKLKYAIEKNKIKLETNSRQDQGGAKREAIRV